ncbi:MAG: hypothetical protein R2839_04855 [Thermomicrobiales bacterium]
MKVLRSNSPTADRVARCSDEQIGDHWWLTSYLGWRHVVGGATLIRLIPLRAFPTVRFERNRSELLLLIEPGWSPQASRRGDLLAWMDDIVDLSVLLLALVRTNEGTVWCGANRFTSTSR